MWARIKKMVKGLRLKVASGDELKKAKWEEFKKANAARIAYLPTQNGRKVVPAIWDKRTKSWHWVTRGQRRRAKLIAGRMYR